MLGRSARKKVLSSISAHLRCGSKNSIINLSVLRIVNFRLFIANLQCSKNNKINKSEKNYHTMFLAFETNSANKSFSILHIFPEIRALFVSRGMLIICTIISIDFSIETSKKDIARPL